ncbi:MAG TPA: chemotaxis protein CheW [Mycobacteriales bacterium]|nr:chemotaxis protein CheW [Mycobacteriales bacterium]
MSDIVTFTLDGCDYATRIDRVREVVRLAELTRLPGMTAPLAGLLDLRGRSLPVLDLRTGGSDVGDILVLDLGGAGVGFACDRVTAVQESASLAPPEAGADPDDTPSGVLPAYVEQVLRGPAGAVFLVDIEAMVADVAPSAAQAAAQLAQA